ncbi:chitinase [Vogesella sp. EB]|uniref:glycoside hydrolase family 19 protein n=1 Tax=Vogesella sp. EB TaxID=1526735 RepID=UPI00064D59DB|nr:glycoside hydrolase family 19 protein [Vogesella sp. EB]KMJ53886.1 chitinase [Vogesella sp. EB]
MLTVEKLIAIMPEARPRAGLFVAPLNASMAEFKIITPLRAAAFLAQVGHESDRLRYTRELGGSDYLDKYDTGRLAARLGNTPQNDDDGQRYCGRGLIQITGRRNYELCGFGLGIDLIAQPELLEQPELACRSAAWFWHNENLNALADKRAFDTITRRINGGQNGREDRIALYQRALKVLA